MPFKIQRQPRGLADLFKSFGGETPKTLEESVRGTVELQAYYRADTLRSLAQTVTLQSAVGAGATIIADSTWELVALMGSIHAPSAVGTIMAGRIALLPLGGNSVDVEQIPQFTSVSATDENNVGVLMPQKLVLRAGFALICALTRPAGGANTVSVTVRALFAPLSD